MNVTTAQRFIGGCFVDLKLISSQSNASSEDIWPRSSLRGTMECPLCLSQQHPSQFPPVMTCHHRYGNHGLSEGKQISAFRRWPGSGELGYKQSGLPLRSNPFVAFVHVKLKSLAIVRDPCESPNYAFIENNTKMNNFLRCFVFVRQILPRVPTPVLEDRDHGESGEHRVSGVRRAFPPERHRAHPQQRRPDEQVRGVHDPAHPRVGTRRPLVPSARLRVSALCVRGGEEHFSHPVLLDCG